MAQTRFSTAAVIGTGMMGPGIAVTLALGGLRTTIVSRSASGAQKGLGSAKQQLELLEEYHLTEPEQARTARELLASSDTLDSAIQVADLVIESAPEDMQFKQNLFAHMDSLSRPETVLATNTSGLSVTAIASRCRRPERVLTTHFWNPPHLMPLVEIVKGEKTSDEIAQSIRRLLGDCGKVPVVVKKDRPGQLGNRLQMALAREGVHIVAEGIADVDDVDLAAKNGFGLRLPVYGIFEHADIVGLDLACAVMDYASQDLYSGTRAPELIQQKVERGELGAKTGKGFYDWSKKSADEVKARRDRFLIEFLLSQKRKKAEVQTSTAR